MYSDKKIEEIEQYLGCKLTLYNEDTLEYRITDMIDEMQYIKMYKKLNPDGFNYSYIEAKQYLYDKHHIINENNINKYILDKIKNLIKNKFFILKLDFIIFQLKKDKLKTILED